MSKPALHAVRPGGPVAGSLRNFRELSTSVLGSAENSGVQHIDTATAAPDAGSPAPERTGPATRYGLPLEAFGRAWTIADVQGYLRIGRTQAYALASDPGFPPRLRTGRSHRWNGLQVMAWMHGEDWRGADHPTTLAETVPADHGLLGIGPTPSRGTARTFSAPGPVRPITSAPTPRPTQQPHPPSPTAAAPTPNPRVVRRVIDPSQVQRQRHAARLTEFTGTAPPRPAASDGASAPTPTRGRPA
jgi:predicted DNA-binding transcriptional regulator AlpA